VTAAVTALALVLLAWFAGGTIWNVRKGRELMRWMQAGLPLLGERTTVRWLGSTAVEMAIRKARPPFEQATVVIFLEPRDVPWLWALGRSGGRRDTLIVRGQLRRTPGQEFLALDRRSWSGRDALRRLPAGSWSVREPSSPDPLSAYYAAPAALARGDALLEVARRAGLAVRRLSLHRADPHFQLHVDLPPPSLPAAAFFEAVRALGERAGA
jgi:hypothetical protein